MGFVILLNNKTVSWCCDQKLMCLKFKFDKVY